MGLAVFALDTFDCAHEIIAKQGRSRELLMHTVPTSKQLQCPKSA